MTPGHATRRALRELHPEHATFVPGALGLSTLLLLMGLSLPLLHAQQMIFWKSTYSVWAGIVALWHAEEHFLAWLLFFFSIVFPFAKLVALAVIWWIELAEEQRVWVLHWLETLGKWSMLDVFIVAVLIILVKLGPLARVEPRSGVYIFAAAIVCSMLTTMYVAYLARRSHRAS